MTEPTYRIKPLEWEDVYGDGAHWFASTTVGPYTAGPRGWTARGVLWGDADSLASAQAAAEAHHRARMEAGLVRVPAAGE